jgi:TM2 domain-containing membrane protein YozV
MTTTSTNNFIPALVSFFIPGLGQLIQGRIVAALLYFVITCALWVFFWAGLATLLPALTLPAGDLVKSGFCYSFG